MSVTVAQVYRSKCPECRSLVIGVRRDPDGKWYLYPCGHMAIYEDVPAGRAS